MSIRVGAGTARPCVLIAGGDPPARERVSRTLVDAGLELSADRPDVVVVLQSRDRAIADLVTARSRFASSRVVFVADNGSERLAVDVFRAGADDYLNAPVTAATVVEMLNRLGAALRPASPAATAFLGCSSAVESLRSVIRRIAATPCNVLVSGETGTGKEVVARLVHESSGRAARPFVTINCSALPETLFESELFGFERGAFTGAQATSIGRLQSANGGTVLLDEIGELSLHTQPKLLRAIDRREVQRLGSRRHETIDVRWIAATNRDLEQLVRDGLFRADLFYRLNVYHLAIPPLRRRPDDVALLAKAFLADYAVAYGRTCAAFTDGALSRLLAHDWPGNVRELRNVVEASLLTSETDAIGPDALPLAVRGADLTSHPSGDVERVRVVAALRAAHGNKSEAAHRLNWSRMTLYRKLAHHRIDVTSECDTVTAKPPRV